MLFVLVAVLGVARAVVGFGSGLLPLLAAAPALAAVAGGLWYVLAVGAEALVVAGIFFAETGPGGEAFRGTVTATVAVTVVTAVAALATTFRARRDRQLARARLVAEAAQQVVLRPLPSDCAPVRLSALYLSASEGARVGGDVYDVVQTGGRLRLLIGDAEGKGLPALRAASAVLGAFRTIAYEEEGLANLAARIEASLGHQFGLEEFVTAILADVTADGSRMDLLCCGHPMPLLLGPAGPRPIAAAQAGLPLGLSTLGGGQRCPVSICLAPGDQVLFYTDGLSEARNRSGEFFPLLGSAAFRAPHSPDTLLDRLSNEMREFTGHAPTDDVALLLVHRDLA